METIQLAMYSSEDTSRSDAFLRLLSDYFDELFAEKPEENIPKEHLPKILAQITNETKNYMLWAYLCLAGSEAIGFSIGQIDSKENPWCKREGWGFIREHYIASGHRRKGYATELYQALEEKLLSHGTKNLYLTTDTAAGASFWESVGYADSGQIYPGNGGRIFEKHQ